MNFFSRITGMFGGAKQPEEINASSIYNQETLTIDFLDEVPTAEIVKSQLSMTDIAARATSGTGRVVAGVGLTVLIIAELMTPVGWALLGGGLFLWWAGSDVKRTDMNKTSILKKMAGGVKWLVTSGMRRRSAGTTRKKIRKSAPKRMFGFFRGKRKDDKKKFQANRQETDLSIGGPTPRVDEKDIVDVTYSSPPEDSVPRKKQEKPEDLFMEEKKGENLFEKDWLNPPGEKDE